MAAHIWFIKNMTHEGAGLFSQFAEDVKVPYSIVDLHYGEPFPILSRDHAVVILGGPDSANDVSHKILKELDALRKCLADGIPCLGVCLGLQLLVKAAGGCVLRNATKEIGFRDPSGGWFEIRKTEAGKKDPLLEGIPDPCRIFQLHGETVSLASPMECLASGALCENQIVKIQDRAYGIQGHVELSERMFEDWIAEDADLRRMDADELRRDFTEVRHQLERTSKTFFQNFLKIAGFLE